jgi:hypothetical protein
MKLPRWTPEDDQLLAECWAAGMHPSEAAERLGRGVEAVKMHAWRIGLRRGEVHLTDAQAKWLGRALDEGFGSFTARANPALKELERIGLVERDPSNRCQWRATVRALRDFG